MISNKYLSPCVYIERGKNLFAKLLLALGIPLRVVTNIDGFKIVFLTTSYLEYLFRAKKSYQREAITMNWLRNLVNPRDVLYDVGANVGAYSLYAGHRSRDFGGQVYAFEPAFFNFYSLSRNVNANGLNDTVIPYSLALGKATGEAKMFLSSTVAGSALHGLMRPESEGKFFKEKFRQGIYVTSLDEFCADSGVSFPNHIKIDVDGGEADIVLGMRSVMSDHRLRSIMIEINLDISAGEIQKNIIDAGFIEEQREQWPGKNIYNILFVRFD